VPDYDFMFVLELSSNHQYDKMLTGLVAALVGSVGFDGTAIAGVARDVCRAFGDDGRKGGRCELRFRVVGDVLKVSITQQGIAGWEMTRPLPDRS